MSPIAYIYPDDIKNANLTFQMMSYINSLSGQRPSDLRRALKVSDMEALRCVRTIHNSSTKRGDILNCTPSGLFSLLFIPSDFSKYRAVSRIRILAADSTTPTLAVLRALTHTHTLTRSYTVFLLECLCADRTCSLFPESVLERPWMQQGAVRDAGVVREPATLLPGVLMAALIGNSVSFDRQLLCTTLLLAREYVMYKPSII